MEGKMDDLKGRAKEAAGDLTNNDDLKREGKTDQIAGNAKEKVEQAEEKVKDVIGSVADKFKK
jgi:uncharacterized protein YjbJ (UPF0337 family)